MQPTIIEETCIGRWIQLNEYRFIKMFRLNKELTNFLIEIVTPFIARQPHASDNLVYQFFFLLLTAIGFFRVHIYFSEKQQMRPKNNYQFKMTIIIT